MNSRNEIPGLTGMRGLASIYVLAYHVGVLFPVVGFPLSVSRIGFYGWSGVDFFFVLSGYLLTFLYSDSGVSKKYAFKRVFRTFPLYYLCAVLFAIGGFVSISPLWIVYAQNYIPQSFTNLPFWTLTLEEAFYFLVFPVFLRLSRRPDFKYLLLGAAFLSLVYRFVVPHDDFALKQLPSYLIDYAAGVWVARTRFSPGRWVKWLAFAAWICVGLVLGGDLNNVVAPVFDAIVYSLVIITMQNSFLFCNRISLWLGHISYSLYLGQLLILLPLSVLPYSPLLLIPAGIAGCLLLAFGFRKGVEEPFLFLGKFVLSKLG